MARSSTHVLRMFAVIALALLFAAACRKSADDNNPVAPETEPPTASPSVQSAGDFGLAGSVDHAFEGVGPPVAVSLAGVSLTPSPGVSGPSGPTASPGAAGATASQQGVMRVTLEQVSAPLHDKCGVSAGDNVNVFWLTDTQFDTSLLSGTSLESSLEGRKLGIAGSIFVTGGNDQTNLGLPTPATTPLATTSPSVVNTRCTLVADSVSSTAGEVLPTVRPRARTRTPAPTVRPTATARPTATPTASPTASPSPSPSSSASAAPG